MWADTDSHLVVLRRNSYEPWRLEFPTIMMKMGTRRLRRAEFVDPVLKKSATLDSAIDIE